MTISQTAIEAESAISFGIANVISTMAVKKIALQGLESDNPEAHQSVVTALKHRNTDKPRVKW